MSEMDPIFKNCDAWLFLLAKLYFPSATILIFYFGEKTRYLVSGVILRLAGAFCYTLQVCCIWTLSWALTFLLNVLMSSSPARSRKSCALALTGGPWMLAIWISECSLYFKPSPTGSPIHPVQQDNSWCVWCFISANIHPFLLAMVFKITLQYYVAFTAGTLLAAIDVFCLFWDTFLLNCHYCLFREVAVSVKVKEQTLLL